MEGVTNLMMTNNGILILMLPQDTLIPTRVAPGSVCISQYLIICLSTNIRRQETGNVYHGVDNLYDYVCIVEYNIMHSRKRLFSCLVFYQSTLTMKSVWLCGEALV